VNAQSTACVFAVDLLLVAAASWLGVRALGRGLAGVLEPLVAWAWAAGAVVAGAGVLLGFLGALGEPGFALVHACLLALLLLARRRSLAGDAGALRGLGRSALAALAPGGPEAAAALLLAGLVLGLGILAAFAHPVVYDALTYRLPRIAQWLQDGTVGHYATSDPRQNYMPVVPDLVMAWLLTGVRRGFRPAALAQWYGGVLLVAATYGLARRTGLGRLPSLGAVALLFGMANVVPQFTTVHTDLFAAGELAAAFCLWACAAERRQGSVLAGLAAGMALGSKGTLFYLIPGALLWVAWVAWRCRLGLRAWTATLVAAALSAGLFAMPVFVRNMRAYGGPFGPADFVRMHHGGPSSGSEALKLRLNLESSFAQLFDPNSQPPGLGAASRGIGEAIARGLPERDPFSYENLNRRGTLLEILGRSAPDADATTFGVLAFLGLVAGAVTAAAAPRRPGAGSVLAWTAGIAVFWGFFHGMQLWHPYGFRYYLLVAPWMAVVAAWWMQTLPGSFGKAAWVLSIAAVLGVTATIVAHTHQAGWRAAAEPERSRGYYVFARWREWAAGLDAPGEPLRIALAFNQPAAAFYRLSSPRAVRPEATPDAHRTAEDLMRGRSGWLIVPAALFMGREGEVAARTWLFDGDPASPFSVAAYRALRTGEVQGPVVYRSEAGADGSVARRELLVRTWADAPLRLVLHNDGGQACRYGVSSPLGTVQGELAANHALEVSLAVPRGAVAEVTGVFGPLSPRAGAPQGVSMDVAP
jgi:hypothetical protein